MHELELQIKHLIIDALKLEDISVDDIDTDAPLFGAGLGLDSLDALEIAMALSKTFGVKLGPNEQQNQALFQNVRSLAQHISAQLENQSENS